MKQSLIRVGLLTATIAFASTVHADRSDEFSSGLYIAPGANYMDVHNIFDAKHSIGMDRKVGPNLSIGYQFDSPWAIEAMYQYTKPERSGSKEKMQVTYGHLDALYTLDMFEGSGWAPYLVSGLGRMSYRTKGFNKWDTTLNTGIGVKYAFTPRFQFRMDGRYTLGTRHVDSGAALNMALVLVLGKHYSQESQSKKPIVAEEPVEETVAEVVEEPAVEEQEPEVEAEEFVDSDGDGVPDHLDECPDTKPGAKVDEKGCYVYLTETHEFNLSVTFAVGSADINENSKGDIEELAQFLNAYPNTNATIEGHSDNTGSAAFNKQLSQKRADSVKQSLIDEFGISAERLTAIGYGVEQPIADNSTAEGRAKNRRVVAKVEAEEQVIQQADEE